MYGTYVLYICILQISIWRPPMRTDMDLDDPILVEIGLAVFRLRRIWAKPDMMRKIREETAGSRPLQMSHLMLVHAADGLCHEGAPEATLGPVPDPLQIDPSPPSPLVGHAT